jgi:hypothetical protein
MREGMNKCPECRSPLASMMMLAPEYKPEIYCERCAHTWPKLAARKPELVLA